jgi:CheY-like chemotaxis protein
VTEVAALLETARDEDVLRRVEGLVSELRGVVEGLEGPVPGLDWLARAAGVEAEDLAAGGEEGSATWRRIGRRAGLDEGELAGRVARYFGLEVAAPGRRSRAAVRLVPEALVTRARVVPLGEDSHTITLATADPTRLHLEREIEGLTGRRPVFVVAPPAVIDSIIDEIYGDALRSAAVPEEKASEDAPGTAVREPDGGMPGTVLVVDDEASARALVRSLLGKRGYAVLEADDGVAALERLASHPEVDLVVADLNMPRMDGLELVWAIREQEPTAATPVIVVTGEADEILETQLLEEGADDYIRKPLDPRLFLARVESTVRRASE